MNKTINKGCYILICLFFLACAKDDYSDFQVLNINTELSIEGKEGLKFDDSYISDRSSFNLKSELGGEYTIELRDPFKNLISKSNINAKSGDNIMTFYTKALQVGDYNIIVMRGSQEKHNVKLTIQ